MGESKSRWMTVWTALGALATAGGVVATVLVAGSSKDNPGTVPTDVAIQTVVTTTSSSSGPSTTRTVKTSAPKSGSRSQSSGDDISSLQEKEFDLQGKLSDVFTNCTPRRDLSSEVTAALNCVSSVSGPSLKPLVMQFPSSSAMSDHYADEHKSLSKSGDCGLGEDYYGTWKRNGVIVGQSVCKRGSKFRMYWSYYSEKIGIAAEGEDARQLYQWWSNYGSKVIG
jgi:hypothetical protein